ncbi:hypothetical protein [Kangiella marina]|uniref:Extradiol ring-cleavage dioxygenase LigAB LigA subunit domain-containing protein n=1 Tax=Kangiella marina TaxID=1079178 RepID=A0ABP8IDB7_9GAMM
MSTLNKFLTELGTNAKLMEAYKAEPVATMEAAGLNDDEINAVQHADMDKVKELTGGGEYAVVVHNVKEHNL